jgi:hypothetical protein
MFMLLLYLYNVECNFTAVETEIIPYTRIILYKLLVLGIGMWLAAEILAVLVVKFFSHHPDVLH